MGSYFEIKNLHLQENTEDIFRYIVTFHNQSCQAYHDTVVSKYCTFSLFIFSRDKHNIQLLYYFFLL